jgi:hypothetical protein
MRRLSGEIATDACNGLLKGRSRFDDFELGQPTIGGLDPDLDRDVCRPQPLWAHWLHVVGL